MDYFLIKKISNLINNIKINNIKIKYVYLLISSPLNLQILIKKFVKVTKCLNL